MSLKDDYAQSPEPVSTLPYMTKAISQISVRILTQRNDLYIRLGPK